jgi:hypothetical protein
VIGMDQILPIYGEVARAQRVTEGVRGLRARRVGTYAPTITGCAGGRPRHAGENFS